MIFSTTNSQLTCCLALAVISISEKPICLSFVHSSSPISFRSEKLMSTKSTDVVSERNAIVELSKSGADLDAWRNGYTSCPDEVRRNLI